MIDYVPLQDKERIVGCTGYPVDSYGISRPQHSEER